jgi:hypothetical protein
VCIAVFEDDCIRFSITSSARTSRAVGTVRPKAFAVLRLMIQLDFRGLHDRQVSRLLALENAAGVDAGLTVRFPVFSIDAAQKLGTWASAPMCGG